MAERLASIKHIILVLSGKGGVGKSSMASQIAFTLAAAGKSTGLLDIDICGPSVPTMLGLRGQKVHQSASGWSPVWLDECLGVMSIGFMLPDEDDAVIWRGPRKTGLIKQFLTDVEWGSLDYLVIDTPPGTSDEHISIVQLLKETAALHGRGGAVIVTTPQEVAMADVRKELNFAAKTSLRVVGVVENMSGFVCPCCGTKTDIFPAPRRRKPIMMAASPSPAIGGGAGGPAGEGHAAAGAAKEGEAATVAAAEAEEVVSGPAAMAARFGVPFLGAVPLDPLLLLSCEAGEAYVTAHPAARGVPALMAVVRAVVEGVEGAGAGAALTLAGMDEDAGEGEGEGTGTGAGAAHGHAHGHAHAHGHGHGHSHEHAATGTTASASSSTA